MHPPAALGDRTGQPHWAGCQASSAACAGSACAAATAAARSPAFRATYSCCLPARSASPEALRNRRSSSRLHVTSETRSPWACVAGRKGGDGRGKDGLEAGLAALLVGQHWCNLAADRYSIRAEGCREAQLNYKPGRTTYLGERGGGAQHLFRA